MVARNLPLGLMTESHMRKLPIQIGLEVKQYNSSYEEARLQILVFMTAYTRKLDELSKDRGTQINFPIIASIVKGHMGYVCGI